MTRSWRVCAILLAGAGTASLLAAGPIAGWADAHADRPGGEALAAVLHRWDDQAGALGRPRDWLRGIMRTAVAKRF